MKPNSIDDFWEPPSHLAQRHNPAPLHSARAEWLAREEVNRYLAEGEPL